MIAVTLSDQIKIKLNILSKKRKLEIPIPDSKFDERDTMFARMARKQNTEAYDHYYSLNPKLKKKDDHIRSLTPLLHKNGKYYNEELSNKAGQLFDSIADIKVDEKIIDQYLSKLKDKSSISKVLKRITLELGAVGVGFTDLEENFIYHHKGRFDNNYGHKIKLNHPNVIVFLVEMDHQRMRNAPKAESIYESANQYYRASYISKVIESLITKLGYKAKAHFDANYDIILPPLAVKAGLGELGRNNILIADKYGSRVRIGAVTTDLHVEYNNQISLGADGFCEVCKKCAENCPSKALSISDKINIRGIEKWPTDIEKCYTVWRKYGTDCGICMATCPFSHKNNLLHNIIRKTVKYLPILNSSMVKLDDIFYGKKWKIRK